MASIKQITAYECPYCGTVWKTKLEAESCCGQDVFSCHKDSKGINVITRYRCPGCGIEYDTRKEALECKEQDKINGPVVYYVKIHGIYGLGADSSREEGTIKDPSITDYGIPGTMGCEMRNGYIMFWYTVNGRNTAQAAEMLNNYIEHQLYALYRMQVRYRDSRMDKNLNWEMT